MERILKLFALSFLSVSLMAMQPQENAPAAKPPAQEDSLLVYIDNFFKKTLPTEFNGFYVFEVDKQSLTRPDDEKTKSSINIGQYFGGELRFSGSTGTYLKVLDRIDKFFAEQFADNPGLASTRKDETAQDITKIGLSPLMIDVYQNPVKYTNYRIAFYDNLAYQLFGPRSKERNSVDIYYLPMGTTFANK